MSGRPKSADSSRQREGSLELRELPGEELVSSTQPDALLPSPESPPDKQSSIFSREWSPADDDDACEGPYSDPWLSLKRFWGHNVALVVPQKKNRDHFGKFVPLSTSSSSSSSSSYISISSALERTFLAYIRTSVMLSMQGTTVAQLFRLQRKTTHSTSSPRLGFYEIGIPLACLYYGVAILVVILGACRFWRQQTAIRDGMVHAGGWEVNCVAMLMTLVSCWSVILVHWWKLIILY